MGSSNAPKPVSGQGLFNGNGRSHESILKRMLEQDCSYLVQTDMSGQECTIDISLSALQPKLGIEVIDSLLLASLTQHPGCCCVRALTYVDSSAVPRLWPRVFTPWILLAIHKLAYQGLTCHAIASFERCIFLRTPTPRDAQKRASALRSALSSSWKSLTKDPLSQLAIQ